MIGIISSSTGRADAPHSPRTLSQLLTVPALHVEVASITFARCGRQSRIQSLLPSFKSVHAVVICRAISPTCIELLTSFAPVAATTDAIPPSTTFRSREGSVEKISSMAAASEGRNYVCLRKVKVRG